MNLVKLIELKAPPKPPNETSIQIHTDISSYNKNGYLKKYSTSHFSNQISGSDKTDQDSYCYGFIWFVFMFMLGQAFAYLVVKVIDGR